jgi:GNAT superfamily N-acetyltransferase
MSEASLATRIVTTFVRRATLMVRHLDEGSTALPDCGATFAALGDDDLSRYVEFRPGASVASLRARFARGDAAVGAWVEGRLVHAAWIATGRAYIAYLRRDLVLGPDELLVYDSFTLPDSRGSGIARARMLHVFDEYGRRGYRRCFALAAAENQAGRQAMASAGYRPAQDYICLRLGPWDRCWRLQPSQVRWPELALPLTR